MQIVLTVQGLEIFNFNTNDPMHPTLRLKISCSIPLPKSDRSFPVILLLNAESKSASRTDEIRHYDCHVKFENNTSGRARLGDTALKFLCPGLSVTSPDHLGEGCERGGEMGREDNIANVRGRSKTNS